MLSSRSTIRNKTLNYFFLNEQNQAYINELARLMDEDPKNVYRSLLQLEAEGLLTSEFKGKQRYFRANTQNPLYNGYKGIFLKTAGIEHLLKEELKKINGIELAYIFGSYAKQTSDTASDIDLLVVGAHNTLDLQKAIAGLQRRVDREINVVSLDSKEYHREKSKDVFLKRIAKSKTIQLI